MEVRYLGETTEAEEFSSALCNKIEMVLKKPASVIWKGPKWMVNCLLYIAFLLQIFLNIFM